MVNDIDRKLFLKFMATLPAKKLNATLDKYSASGTKYFADTAHDEDHAMWFLYLAWKATRG